MLELGIGEKKPYSPIPKYLVLDTNTSGGTQPPVSSTAKPSTIDLFSPENNDEDVTAQVQSATTTNPPITTAQDNNKFGLELGTLKRQWLLLAAISMAAVTSLGLLWKYAVRIGV